MILSFGNTLLRTRRRFAIPSFLLAADAVSFTEIDLEWSAVSGAAKYQIYRDSSPLTTLAPNVTSFSGTPTTISSVIGTAGSFGGSGNTKDKVFDGNLATYFDAPSANGAWAGADFGSAKVINFIKYCPRPTWAARMVGGKIQASTDPSFAAPVDLFTITSTPTEGVLTAAGFDNSTAYQYYRYLGPNDGYCNIAELQFFESANVTDVVRDPLPTTYADTAVSPGESHSYEVQALTGGGYVGGSYTGGSYSSVGTDDGSTRTVTAADLVLNCSGSDIGGAAEIVADQFSAPADSIEIYRSTTADIGDAELIDTLTPGDLDNGNGQFQYDDWGLPSTGAEYWYWMRGIYGLTNGDFGDPADVFVS